MRLPRFFRFFYYLNWYTLKQTVRYAMQSRLSGLSAEMAYNSMLALFPAILALVTAMSLFEDTIVAWLYRFIGLFQEVEGESLQASLRNIAIQLRIIAPDMAWQLLTNFVTQITQVKNRGLLSVSFFAAIWISSAAVGAAMNALDQIDRVPKRFRRPFWKAKLVSIVLTLGSIALLAIASFLILIGDLLVKFFVDVITRLPNLVEILPGFQPLSVKEAENWANTAAYLLDIWQWLSWPVALCIVIIAFAFIYRFGPSRWDVGTPILPGATLAALSWAGISSLFRIYVANFGQYNKVYGAVGAVIVLMLWLYLSSLVMLLGAQLNAIVGQSMRKSQKNKAIVSDKIIKDEL
ncbi:MAG: YihY/virulence factor BrkB family protein [Spirulinaceae cyanobacterium]